MSHQGNSLPRSGLMSVSDMFALTFSQSAHEITEKNKRKNKQKKNNGVRIRALDRTVPATIRRMGVFARLFA